MRALVLGGKGDIGRAVTERFRQVGHEVFAVGRDDFDLTNAKQIADFFESHGSDFDLLIHSGGYNVPKNFEVLTEEEIRISLDSNLFGFLDVVRRCCQRWQTNRYGRIVVLSSLYGFLGRRGRLPYVMSKHALNGAVKTLAIELAAYGVLINSVSPGYIKTRLTYRNNTANDIEKISSSIPMGRMGDPSEIAKVVEFLCSDLNTYINGQDIVVDGGYSIGGFL